MKLSVVIVNYNVKYYLEQCLRSVYKASEGIAMEVFVVDNASTDDSMEYLCPRFPGVNFIKNSQNMGFSRANNQAIVRTVGQYVLLLNPDTIVGENVFQDCITFLDAHPQAGATGVAMLKYTGSFAWESRRGLPTPFTSFCKMSGLGDVFPHSRWFGRYYMRYLDRKMPNEIEVVSGAFNMLRREALDKTGLLDEDFFMYGEDIDLSYRLLQKGYKNYYIPSQIIHYKGESTEKSSFRYVHVFYNAMLIFFDKHYKSSYYLLSFLIRMAVYIRAFLDICVQQIDKIEHALSKKRDVASTEKYLFIGSAPVLEQAQELCSRNKLKADFVEATEKTHPQGHLNLPFQIEQYDYVVYDTNAYSYQTIFELMSRGERKFQVALATYSEATHKLITHKEIYY